MRVCLICEGCYPYIPGGVSSCVQMLCTPVSYTHLDVYKRQVDAGYDAIISRGGTATLIRETTDLPVISIQLSVYDVLRTIRLAQSYSNLYAIVGFPDITEAAHTPVSYTHLCPADRQSLRPARSFLRLPRRWAGTGRTAPVSYTHLDVYKRQAMSRSRQAWGFTAQFKSEYS